MNDKKENKITGMEAISMMVDSLSVDVVIKKRPGENYSLSGLTGITVVDLYILFNALEVQAERMKKLFKSKEDMKKALGQIVENMVDEIYEEEETEDEG